MRDKIKSEIYFILIGLGVGSYLADDTTDKIADLIDQDQQETTSGASIDSALTSFNKLEAAIKDQLALIDEIKAVLNPEPEPKAEEVHI